VRRGSLIWSSWGGALLGAVAAVAWPAGPSVAQQAPDISILRPSLAPAAPPALRLRPLGDDDDAGPPPPVPTAALDAIQPADGAGSGTRLPPPPERAQADGETDPPVSADLPVNGHVELTVAQVPGDGIEPFASDPRLPADRAAFLGPPAGYDQLAFQIELDPANDARTARLAQFQPFAPVGHRAGSWVIFPMVEAGITATSNVYATSQSKPDLIFDVRPTLLAVTDWDRHAIQFKATALASAYDQHATEDDHSYAFEARGRIDVNRQINIEVLVSHSLDQDLRSSVFAPTDAAERTPYSTDKLAVAYNQRLGHLSIQLRSSITATGYQNVAATDGSLIDNTNRDLVARDVALRTAWNFNPALAIFTETSSNTQSYAAIPTDGIGRDSVGTRTRIGLSFGSVSQIWRGEISTGYGRQQALDSRLADVDGILLDANLAWRPTKITSVLLDARTDFVTSTVVGQGNGTQHTASAELRQSLSSRLNGIAGISFQEIDFVGNPLTQRTASESVGFEYYLDRSTTLLGQYKHSTITDSTGAANSNTDLVRFGVRYQP